MICQKSEPIQVILSATELWGRRIEQGRKLYFCLHPQRLSEHYCADHGDVLDNSLCLIRLTKCKINGTLSNARASVLLAAHRTQEELQSFELVSFEK